MEKGDGHTTPKSSHNDIESLASSVSSVTISQKDVGVHGTKTHDKSYLEKDFKTTNLASVGGTNSGTLLSSALQNSVGNLNLPHITSHHEQTSSSSANLSQECTSLSVGKMRAKFSLEDLEILSTIGTGTFGRVVLVKECRTKDYFALKVMKIGEIIKLKQVEHVKNEKLVLSLIQHPFIVQLYWASHDDTFLYMLLEFVCGGELFTYLRNAGKFNNATTLFFAAEIVLALEYLHSLHIVYRDLKPENILLDRDGHIKLTDFGFAKRVENRTWTLCGTPEYLSPEVIQSKGHGKSVDWWALGILIYEMLAGVPPFWDESPFGIYQKILGGKLEFPNHFDPQAKDIMKKLLTVDRTRRLGNMRHGAEDVKSHKWFQTIDWSAVNDKKIMPPIIPRVKHSGDTRNFDDYPEENWKMTRPASPSALAIFAEF